MKMKSSLILYDNNSNIDNKSNNENTNTISADCQHTNNNIIVNYQLNNKINEMIIILTLIKIII